MKIWWLYIYGKISETTWEHDDLIDLNVIKHEIVTPSSLFVYVFNLEPYVITAQEKNGPATAIYIYIYNRFQILKRPRKQSLTRYGGWGGRVKWWFQERLRNHYLLIRSLGFKLVFRAPLWAWGRASMYSDPLGGHLKEHLTTERGGFPWISEFSCSGRAERLSLAQCTQRYQFYIPQ